MADDTQENRALVERSLEISDSGDQASRWSHVVVNNEINEGVDPLTVTAELNEALVKGADSSKPRASSLLGSGGSCPNSPTVSINTDSEHSEGDSNNMPREQGNLQYVAPLEDPYEKAWKYLSKHNILQLFQSITTDIAYKQPGDPINYMIEEIEKLQEQDRRRKGVVRLPISKPASAKQHTEPDSPQS